MYCRARDWPPLKVICRAPQHKIYIDQLLIKAFFFFNTDRILVPQKYILKYIDICGTISMLKYTLMQSYIVQNMK